MYFIASSQEAEGKIEFFPMLRKSGYLRKSSSQFIIRATLHLTSLINADETNALETPKCQKPKKSTPSVNFPAEVAYIPFTTSHALSILSVFYNAQNSFNSQNNIIRIPHWSRTAGDWWSQDSNPGSLVAKSMPFTWNKAPSALLTMYFSLRKISPIPKSVLTPQGWRCPDLYPIDSLLNFKLGMQCL